MPLQRHTQPLLTNHILASLPADEYGRLTLGAERFRLTPGKTLFNAGDEIRHAYFPLSGMASLVAETEDGRSVEVAAVGSEGMVGIPVVLRASRSPYRVMAQLPGEAVKVKAGALRSEFERNGKLRDLVLRHALALLTQLAQSVVCHRFHTVEQRLACWLLMTRERAGGDSFRLTQEFISYMLGVPRTSVTAFAVAMRRAGLINYSRGRITVRNVRELEAASCDCYHIVAREITNLLAA
jgi:CRP-like cAMP-binding protein